MRRLLYLHGMLNISKKRIVEINEHQTKKDWTVFLEEVAENYKLAEKITLVMDNYNTHVPGSFYEVFVPEKAKNLLNRFEFVYSPKHGSWLNMAEIELKHWLANAWMGESVT